MVHSNCIDFVPGHAAESMLFVDASSQNIMFPCNNIASLVIFSRTGPDVSLVRSTFAVALSIGLFFVTN